MLFVTFIIHKTVIAERPRCCNQGGLYSGDFVNNNVLSDKTNISKHLRGTNTMCSNLVWFLGKLDFKLVLEDSYNPDCRDLTRACHNIAK